MDSSIRHLVRPVYQPVACTGSGVVRYFEALARVQGDTETMAHVPLLAIAETHRFVHLLDLHMLEQVIADMNLHDWHVGVNMSPITIEGHSSELMAILSGATLAVTQRLTVEITESVAIQDLGAALSFVHEVRRRFGIKVALDDFGSTTGYITTELVRAIRPDVLKIDGTLLERAIKDGRTEHFVEALDLGLEVGADVVAEWVDSSTKLAFLKLLGVKLAQGCHVGSAAALPTWQATN